MYPKVFADFAAAQETYGPVSVLPTPVYFYGMQLGDEIFVDIERGKTLVVRCLAVGDGRREGHGHACSSSSTASRAASRCPTAAAATPRSKPRRKAEPGNDAPCRRADAGRRLDRRGRGRPGGQGRRRAAVDRGDEDGDGAARRARRHDRGGAGAAPATRSTPRTCWWCMERRHARGRRGDPYGCCDLQRRAAARSRRRSPTFRRCRISSRRSASSVSLRFSAP